MAAAVKHMCKKNLWSPDSVITYTGNLRHGGNKGNGGGQREAQANSK